MADEQQKIEAAQEPEKSKKATKKAAPKQLISLSEYRAGTDRNISDVLAHGFRIWMRTVKNQPLRARTISDWDNLIDQYLIS